MPTEKPDFSASIRVLGEISIEIDGAAVTLPDSMRAIALLGWLAVNPGLRPRSEIASTLWPDVPDVNARKSVRTALWALRRAFTDHADALLTTTRDRIGLRNVSVDLHRFEKLIESEQFDDAMALSSGEVLAGIDDEWALRVRDAHRNKLVSLLRDGSDRAAADGNHNLAIARARQAADLNPLSESCARLLMRRYEEIGDRSIALGVYTRIVDRLRKELKIGPSEETWQLAQTIRRRGQHEGGHTMTAAGTVRPVGSDSVRRMERIGAVGVTTHHRQPVIGNNPYITQVRATPRTAPTLLQRPGASVSLPGRIR